MGIRTCFANDGPAAAASSAAVVIRTLFMVASPRAASARLGGVGDGRFAEKGLRLARPQGRSWAPHTPQRSRLSTETGSNAGGTSGASRAAVGRDCFLHGRGSAAAPTR